MPKVRLTPTEDPQVFELEEVEEPTVGDFLIEKTAELSDQVWRLEGRLTELEKRAN